MICIWPHAVAANLPHLDRSAARVNQLGCFVFIHRYVVIVTGKDDEARCTTAIYDAKIHALCFLSGVSVLGLRLVELINCDTQHAAAVTV